MRFNNDLNKQELLLASAPFYTFFGLVDLLLELLPLFVLYMFVGSYNLESFLISFSIPLYTCQVHEWSVNCPINGIRWQFLALSNL